MVRFPGTREREHSKRPRPCRCCRTCRAPTIGLTRFDAATAGHLSPGRVPAGVKLVIQTSKDRSSFRRRHSKRYDTGSAPRRRAGPRRQASAAATRGARPRKSLKGSTRKFLTNSSKKGRNNGSLEEADAPVTPPGPAATAAAPRAKATTVHPDGLLCGPGEFASNV